MNSLDIVVAFGGGIFGAAVGALAAALPLGLRRRRMQRRKASWVPGVISLPG